MLGRRFGRLRSFALGKEEVLVLLDHLFHRPEGGDAAAAQPQIDGSKGEERREEFVDTAGPGQGREGQYADREQQTRDHGPEGSSARSLCQARISPNTSLAYG